MRILVDTNIFLDFFLQRDNYGEAKIFFSNCRKARFKLYVSPMSLRDIEYVAHRITGNKHAAMKIVKAVYALCEGVIDLNEEDVKNSISSEFNDFEDSLLSCSAHRSKIDLIITNNVKDYKKSIVPAWSATDFNNVIRREKNGY